jgi:hypothetical protein
MNKNTNEYDQIKGMLSKIRTFNNTPTKNLREQVENQQQNINPTPNPNTNPTNGVTEPTDNVVTDNNSDLNVINNVEVKIHSDDQQDLTLKDEEKGKISQLIDDFRQEVSETVDFGSFDIYDNSGKLNGKLGNNGVDFVLSGGDDQGIYITASMLKIDDDTLGTINKLRVFENKFMAIVNDLIINRKEN